MINIKTEIISKVTASTADEARELVYRGIKEIAGNHSFKTQSESIVHDYLGSGNYGYHCTVKGTLNISVPKQSYEEMPDV